jgi:dipeptidase E
MKLYLTSIASASLDEIVKDLPKKPSDYKILFIPTAADTYAADNRPWFDADRNKFIELGFKLEDFDLKGKTESDVREAVGKVDIIFVSGGNTFYLLEHVKKSGFDKVMREIARIEGEHLRGGAEKIYIGSSAGSIIMGPVIRPLLALDHKELGDLDNYDAIGLVDFVILPHWGRGKYKEKQAAVIKEYGHKYKLKPIKDGEMVVVR